jgi:hypothetical protein
MRRFKEKVNNTDLIDHNIDEGLLTGISMERRLHSLASSVASTSDLGKKMDIE